MQGDPEVIEFLNEQLTAELTAINQYFLHAKMQANWGFTKLAEHTKAESIDEMRHAERITDRILFLEGLPNYQKLLPLRIGQTVREQFEADLAVELEVVERLRPGIRMCRKRGDATTANLLEDILASEEEHIDYLETNLGLIDRLGEQLYLSQLVERPPTNG
jgi:bacterioferritin